MTPDKEHFSYILHLTPFQNIIICFCLWRKGCNWFSGFFNFWFETNGTKFLTWIYSTRVSRTQIWGKNGSNWAKKGQIHTNIAKHWQRDPVDIFVTNKPEKGSNKDSPGCLLCVFTKLLPPVKRYTSRQK